MADSRGTGEAGGSGEAASVDPVFVVDELELRVGQLDAFLTALETGYRPGAEARGQRLLQVLVSPPTRSLEIPHAVTLLWQVEGIAGFWGVRSQNATEDVLSFWADCDARWVASRTRRYAASPERIPVFDAAGRVNA